MMYSTPHSRGQIISGHKSETLTFCAILGLIPSSAEVDHSRDPQSKEQVR